MVTKSNGLVEVEGRVVEKSDVGVTIALKNSTQKLTVAFTDDPYGLIEKAKMGATVAVKISSDKARSLKLIP